MRQHPLAIDLKAFAQDIDALRSDLKQDTGAKDLAHFKKIELLVWLLAFLGLATAWMGPNLFSILALAAASFARWTIVTHHISHRGYEKIPGAPKRYNSKTYARGWRRIVDWLDWVDPDAWHHEHDVLHHYNLGEEGDPDVPQNNTTWMRNSKLPKPFKYLLILFISMVWKPLYYAPNTLNSLLNKQEKTNFSYASLDLWSPLRKRFWQVMWRCWLPYTVFRFGILPALFLFISPEAWAFALINILIAEIVTNIWSYVVIVPNHAGDDIYVFNQHPSDRANFYLNQIVGSVDYNCGGNVRDAMQGWLNYQVEHHVFPDLTVRQYQRAHDRIREICIRHQVPLVTESIFKRVWKLTQIMTGATTQPIWPGIVDTSLEVESELESEKKVVNG